MVTAKKYLRARRQHRGTLRGKQQVRIDCADLGLDVVSGQALTYQLRDFVKGRFFCFVGTWAMAMTSLKDKIWIPVRMITTHPYGQ